MTTLRLLRSGGTPASTLLRLYRSGGGGVVSTRVRLFRSAIPAGAGPSTGSTRLREFRSAANNAGYANQGPIVNIGYPTVVDSGQGFTLVGSDSDVDGSVVARAWYAGSLPSGPVLATSAVVNQIAPVVSADTTLAFTYAATDDDGVTNAVTILVMVRAAVDWAAGSSGALTPLVWR